ncbi:TM0996/MTH895 family glutaredoxin-like protein [bacterium]|nr:TM0996/MTH895 family glutaredoxin-like protein [bacterium]
MKRIQILGTGCPKCEELARIVQKVIEELDGDYQVEKITDINDILSFGVMMTPSLVVDGQVKLVGKIPLPEEIKSLLLE